MSDSRFDILDTIVGIIMGAITTFLTLMGMINSRFDRVYKRVEDAEKNLGDHAVNISALNAHHQANTQFQDRVDHSLQHLEAQNSEQLQQNAEMLNLLGELKGTIQNRKTDR